LQYLCDISSGASALPTSLISLASTVRTSFSDNYAAADGVKRTAGYVCCGYKITRCDRQSICSERIISIHSASSSDRISNENENKMEETTSDGRPPIESVLQYSIHSREIHAKPAAIAQFRRHQLSLLGTSVVQHPHAKLHRRLHNQTNSHKTKVL